VMNLDRYDLVHEGIKPPAAETHTIAEPVSGD
jgi:hypothetical protein